VTHDRNEREEHLRLEQRTDELNREHAALSRRRVPFNQINHDKHSADLAEHKVILGAHKARPDWINP